METKTQPTLIQRLEADSPLFFKKAELLGIALIALAASLTTIPGLSIVIPAIIGAIGTTMKVVSMFAVKDITTITNPNASLQDYIDLSKDLQKQIEEVRGTIKNTIETIKNPPPINSVMAEDIPVIKEEPVAIPDVQLPEVKSLIITDPIIH